MSILLGVNTIFLLFFGAIWSRDGIQNLVLKLVLFALGFWNAFVWLKVLGYIVKL